MLGNFLAIKPLNWDEIIDEHDDEENWEDPRAPSSGKSHPGNGYSNDDGKGEQDMQGGEKGPAKGKGTNDGKGKEKATEDGKGNGKGQGKTMEEWKRKGNGNVNRDGKGKDIVTQTPAEEDVCCAVGLQLKNEM